MGACGSILRACLYAGVRRCWMDKKINNQVDSRYLPEILAADASWFRKSHFHFGVSDRTNLFIAMLKGCLTVLRIFADLRPLISFNRQMNFVIWFNRGGGRSETHLPPLQCTGPSSTSGVCSHPWGHTGMCLNPTSVLCQTPECTSRHTSVVIWWQMSKVDQPVF